MRAPTIPKTLAAALKRYADGVESYHMELDAPGAWAVWISLKPGWVCPDMECGTIHETNSREAVAKLKTIKLQAAPCPFCGHPFDQDELGRYGCPNCQGEGLPTNGTRPLPVTHETIAPQSTKTRNRRHEIHEGRMGDHPAPAGGAGRYRGSAE